MNLSHEKETAPAPVASSFKNLRLFGLAVGVFSLLFIKPLFELMNLALHSELYSHVPLIPCVSFYLLWQKRNQLADRVDSFSLTGTRGNIPRQNSPWAATLAFGFGICSLAFYWLFFRKSAAFNSNDELTLTIFAFVAFIFGTYLLLLGKNIFSRDGFPIAFLLFMVPFPLVATNALETFFQHTSADAAYAMLQLANETVFRTDLQFRLPGITIAVAPECSGIRSTLVLFITSLIAGHLFLRSPWKKLILAIFVIPLAIVRNGFRIFTIAELCVHVGPEMIDSPIHHRGGPIFFLISLVPFFILLIYLQKSERPRKAVADSK
jgi:exosortase C (VPDSG-CTERM-specific)